MERAELRLELIKLVYRPDRDIPQVLERVKLLEDYVYKLEARPAQNLMPPGPPNMGGRPKKPAGNPTDIIYT